MESIEILIENTINHPEVSISPENLDIFKKMTLKIDSNGSELEKLVDEMENKCSVSPLSIFLQGISHNTQIIIIFSLIGLTKYAYSKSDQIVPYIGRLNIIFTESEDESILSKIIGILGDISYSSALNKKRIMWPKTDLDLYASHYQKIHSLSPKKTYIRGLSSLLIDAKYFNDAWVQILVAAFYQDKDLSLRSHVLTCLSALSYNEAFHNKPKSESAYEYFFKGLLEEIITSNNSYQDSKLKSTSSSLSKEIIIAIEQTSYHHPSIIESFFDKYEKVVGEWSSRDESSDTRNVFIQNPCFNLIKYHKTTVNSSRIIKYNSKVLEILKNQIETEKQKIFQPDKKITNQIILQVEKEITELEINSLQHEIIQEIAQSNTSAAKSKFKVLDGRFAAYLTKYKKPHSCIPTWKIIEDLLHLVDCDLKNLNYHTEMINESLKIYRDTFKDNFLGIINEMKTMPVSQLDISKATNLKQCLAIKDIAYGMIENIINKSKDLESPALQKIIRQVSLNQKDILSEKTLDWGEEYIENAGRKRGRRHLLPRSPRLVEVTDLLSNLNLKVLFPNFLPNEEKEINPKIVEELKKKFQNVELHKILAGRTHIDIVVDGFIAIEVKKLTSNSLYDFINGQLQGDFLKGNYKYGILFGIDQTSNGQFLGLHNHAYFEGDGIIMKIIHKDPFV